jgi:UDP-N-acetylmuramoyl-L-alanyl-D-glutamate--2,6-diaminopimelate ligase
VQELALAAGHPVAGDRPPLPAGPYLVAGLGKAGRAAVELLVSRSGAEGVRAWDGSRAPAQQAVARRLEQDGVRCRLGGDGVEALTGEATGCLVKSPGIPMDAPIVGAARAQRVVVIDELELAWRASPLPVLAVTGTKGKSTVTTLLAAVGKAAYGSAHVAGNTDFGPALSAVHAKTGAIACEVSSYQIEGCTDLLPDVAVFTNVHTEANRHGSPEATFAIKRSLFVRGRRSVSVAVVNADDPRGLEIGQAVADRGGTVLRYGQSPQADYKVLGGEWSLDRATVELSTPFGPVAMETRLPGLRNAVNASAAVAAGVAVGLSVEESLTAVGTASPPPGRYQCVSVGQPFDVVVDMAHTPESIRELLATLRAVVARRPGAALRTVLGVPGSFSMVDPRQASGRIARELSDQLIVTGSSLRGEPPLMNMASILRGARTVAGAELCSVLDRRKAIRLVVESAQPGDVVALIGRGPIRDMSFDRHGGGYLGADAELVTEALLESLDALSRS